MKRLLALLMAMMMIFSFAACGSDEEEPAEETNTQTEEKTEETTTEEEKTAEEETEDPLADKTVRLATPGNYNPFTIYDEKTGEWSGFELDLWEIICDKLGFELEIVQLDNPATFAELDLGRVDTVAKQISITPARQEKYDFTQPFFFSPYCLTVREDNDEIVTWDDMEGKTIGLAEGSAMNEFVEERDPDNKVKKNIYESHGSILLEVGNGRVDACPYAYLVLPYWLESNPDIKLKSVDIDNPIYTEVNAYPFARTDRGNALRELVDETLTEMIADGSYGELCEEWFGMDVMESQPAKDYFAANPKN